MNYLYDISLNGSKDKPKEIGSFNKNEPFNDVLVNIYQIPK